MNYENKKQELVALLKSPGKSFVAPPKLRASAIKAFQQGEFPTRKTEAWKHTDISAILQPKYLSATANHVPEKVIRTFAVPALNQNLLVFINGEFSEKYTQIVSPGFASRFVAGNIAQLNSRYPVLFEKYFESTEIAKKNIFATLNTAFATGGTFVHIKKNQEVKEPIHILHLVNSEEPVLIQPRNLILAEANSHAKIIESYHSLTEEQSFTNVATEVIVHENASLDYNIFQGEGDEAFQINNMKVRQFEDSRFSCNTTTLCGALVRNEIYADLLGKGADTALNGLYLADKEQHFDNFTYINHAKPHCTSNQLYKGVIDDRAMAVFLGLVYVAQDAQKTDANQSNRNILLTEQASARSKPQLEIYADDVSCTHGSTTGQIDKEALFYLRSRAIGQQKARIMLLNAFVAEVSKNIKIEAFRNYVDFLVFKRMSGEKVKNQCLKIKKAEQMMNS